MKLTEARSKPCNIVDLNFSHINSILLQFDNPVEINPTLHIIQSLQQLMESTSSLKR